MLALAAGVKALPKEAELELNAVAMNGSTKRWL
jgi:hypothetical protein